MPVGKSTPRFLPTLTEVVHPVTSPRVSTLDREQLIESVLQRVAPLVEAQLTEMLQRLVHEHMESISSQMQSAVSAAVRESVTQALAQDGGLDV